MKKYIFLLLVLIFIVGFQGYRMVADMQSQHERLIDNAIQVAEDKEGIRDVKRTDYFTGPQSYYVVEGTNAQQVGFFVFVPEDTKENVFKVRADEGVSREKISNVVKGPGIEIIRIVPGKINNRVVWEAVTKEANDTWVYNYYDYYHGDTIKTIELPSQK